MIQPPQKYPFVDLTNDRAFKKYFSSYPEVLLLVLKAFLPLPDKKSIHSFQFITDKNGAKNQNRHKKKQKETAQGREEDKKSFAERPQNIKLSHSSDLILKDSVLSPSIGDEKQVILDLNVRLNTGEKIDVEMQAVSKKGFSVRALFYWSRLFTHGLRKGTPYHQLSPTYSLIFTKFPLLGRKNREIVTSHSIRSDKPPHDVLTSYLNMTIVDLSLFQQDKVQNLVDERSKWCYFLKRSGVLTLEEADLLVRKGEDMALALKFLHELSAEDRRWAEEQAIDKFERDRIAEREYAYDEGFEKGTKDGRAYGHAQGLKEGHAEGHAEGMETVALNMLKKQADIAFISEVTGLSEEEINKLKNGS